MKSLDIRVKKKQSRSIAGIIGNRRKWPWALLGGVVFTGAILFVFGYYLLPEADILVQARVEPVTRDLEIRVDKNQSEPSMVDLVVPGTILDQDVSGSKKVLATGTKNVGSKGSGFVSIYNFSKTTLILRAGTTTLTANGRKYFFTQDASNIRPTAFIGLEQQEVDQTSLIAPVPVVAEKPGTDFNLTKGTRLEISNEAFGSKPKTLYAVVSDEGITGGTNKDVMIVTEADITTGYKNLTDELIAQARSQLFAKLEDAKMLDNAVASQVVEQKASVLAGKDVSEFEISETIRLKGLFYREKDVLDVVFARVGRLLPETKNLQTDSGFRLQSSFKAVDIGAGQGLLANHFEGVIVYQLNAEEIAGKLRGKNADQIRELLLSRQDIAELEVEFHPFWVKKAPMLLRNIKVRVKDSASSN